MNFFADLNCLSDLKERGVFILTRASQKEESSAG